MWKQSFIGNLTNSLLTMIQHGIARLIEIPIWLIHKSEAINVTIFMD